ncbi:MAG: SCO1664 family protein [Actinomycetota bacterium]|nr:SCO1664 family protein [Actinomycetota bacterium]
MDPEVKPGGDLDILGLLPAASNYTFLARRRDGTLVVYKPQRGEAPLWDFPSGTLWRREVAAYAVARAAGWEFVPPTVLAEGPLGIGAVQLFVDHDASITAFELVETHPRELKQIAVFDLLTNNADRKAGHVFIDADGRVWGVDHGLCFHVQPKLRTVLWDFVGEPIPDEDLAAVEGVCRAVEQDPSLVGDLLAPQEVDALRKRARLIARRGVFPPADHRRSYPWPPI